MRGATQCAKRLRSLFSMLRSRWGKVGHLPLTDPITQLILGVLSRDTPESKASDGLERLRSMVVDYNELRVIPAIELAEALSDFPDARLKCEDISRALNAVFAREHSISLDRLASLPKKEVQSYLDKIDGLEPYTRARIRLLGLRQHAIPLDEAMWALARAQGIVAPRCTLQEAQQFLERQIAEEDALEFVALLKRHAWSELGGAVKRREVARITSVPPDRTTRNMLQLMSGLPLDSPEVTSSQREQPSAPPATAPGPQPKPRVLTAAGTRRAARVAGERVQAAGRKTGRAPPQLKPARSAPSASTTSRTSKARRRTSRKTRSAQSA